MVYLAAVYCNLDERVRKILVHLNIIEIDLKAASKFFSQRFACGSSVTGPDEIVIQGDVKDDLFDVLPEKWQQVQLLNAIIIQFIV